MNRLTKLLSLAVLFSFGVATENTENTIDEKSVIPGLTLNNLFSNSVYRMVSRSTFGLGPTKLIWPLRTNEAPIHNT